MVDKNSSKSRCQLSRWVISHRPPLISAVCKVSGTLKYSNLLLQPELWSGMPTEKDKVYRF